jgi:hypothetical protein
MHWCEGSHITHENRNYKISVLQLLDVNQLEGNINTVKKDTEALIDASTDQC